MVVIINGEVVNDSDPRAQALRRSGGNTPPANTPNQPFMPASQSQVYDTSGGAANSSSTNASGRGTNTSGQQGEHNLGAAGFGGILQLLDRRRTLAVGQFRQPFVVKYLVLAAVLLSLTMGVQIALLLAGLAWYFSSDADVTGQTGGSSTGTRGNSSSSSGGGSGNPAGARPSRASNYNPRGGSMGIGDIRTDRL